jgi:hypothetical protein
MRTVGKSNWTISLNSPAPRTSAAEVEPYFRRIAFFGRFSLHESSEFDGRAATAAGSAEEPCRVHSTSKPRHGRCPAAGHRRAPALQVPVDRGQRSAARCSPRASSQQPAPPAWRRICRSLEFWRLSWPGVSTFHINTNMSAAAGAA